MKQHSKITKKTVFVFKSKFVKREFNTDPTVTVVITATNVL